MDNGVIEYNIPDLMKSIMDGFKSTPLQGMIIIGTIVLLVLFSVLFVVFSKRRKKRKQVRLAEQVYNETLHEIEFTPAESSLLSSLADNVRGGKEKKYLAVTDRKTFHRTAKKMVLEGLAEKERMENLEKKLAFCCFTDLPPIETTDDLPEGTHLYVVTDENQGFNGKLEKREDGSLIIYIGRGEALRKEEGEIDVFLRRRELHYKFTAPYKKRGGRGVEIPGPVPVVRTERRDYYRREVRMPADIRRLREGAKTYRTKLLELSGGGATLRNPENALKEGEEAVLLLDLPEGEKVSLPSSVVRTSSEGKKIHLQFENIQENLRDRLIGFLLNWKEE